MNFFPARRYSAGLLPACALLALLPCTVPAYAQAPGSEVYIIGLEDTIRRLDRLPIDKQSVLEAKALLTLFQGLGRKGRPEGGRARLEYHVELTDSGQITINGQDIIPLLGAASNQAKGTGKKARP